MIQQGQVFKLKAKCVDGEPLWAYRYRVAGRGSARRQVGGFSTKAEAQRSLQKKLARLLPGGRADTLLLGEWVEEYLDGHQGERVTIAKLRWLLGKATAELGEVRLAKLSPEQPAELRHRDALTRMRVQVLHDPLAERQRRRTAAGHEPRQLVLKRPLRLSSGAEPARLQPRRTAACDAIAVGPQRLPIRASRLQLEDLTLLDHLGTSSIDNQIEESHPRRDDDHPSRREVVTVA